ncbi:MAG: cob(I)yrinic acid a,c-diamide adenosyltransferase [Elusimicrobiota bacterium]
MRIYTRSGDKGKTGLRGGRRVRKDDPGIVVLGELDELSSAIGAALSVLPRRRTFRSLSTDLARVQADLLRLGAVLALPQARRAAAAFPEDAAAWLEAEIDRMASGLEPAHRFILPGGAAPGAFLHMARAVCRRAERAACAPGSGGAPPGALAYLNRLSDYLFTAARWANRKLKTREILWAESP